MSSKPQVTSTDKSQQQTSTAEATPWGPQSNYFLDLYKKGASAVNATNNKPYTGDFIAAPTQGQRDAVGLLYGAAPGLSTGASDLRTMAGRIAGGEFLDPNNPILTSAIGAVNNPGRLNLLNSVLPNVDDASIRGGAYGGTAPALLKTQAISDQDRNEKDTASKMTLDWVTSRMNDIFQAPGLFKSANDLALAPGTVTGMAGEAERGLNQLGLDNAIAKDKEKKSAPFFGLQDFANLLNTGGFGTKTGSSSGTGTSTETGPEPDMLTQILQGVMGGAGTLSSLGQAFPQTMGSLGSLIMPALMMSDRRVKEDIYRIGTADNGLPIYRFRFIGQAQYHLGFMADEVELFRPEAVTEIAGIKHVDYHLASEA